MFDITKLSNTYDVRRMNDDDADEILSFCKKNTQYYLYCGKSPTKELILNDLHLCPPGIEMPDKYYVGFYDEDVLVAIMDLIDGYPEDDIAYIGFFMMNNELQGRNIGTMIIDEVCRYLKKTGMKAVRLGIDKGNPQSTHFWNKNGFKVTDEVEREGWIILIAERTLQDT